MYNLISLFGSIIRYYLPNPYENFFLNENYALIFNILVGGIILHTFAFWLTGYGYTNGVSEPILGSIGFTVSYIVLTFVIILISLFVNNISLFITLFIIMFCILAFITNKIFKQSHCL